MTFPSYRVRLWHSSYGWCQTSSSWCIKAISENSYGWLWNNEIPVMVVAARTHRRLLKVLRYTPEKTQMESNGRKIPILLEFMTVQGTDIYCDGIRSTVKLPGLSFSFDKNGFSEIHSVIDKAVQNVVPQLVHPVILQLTQHSTLAGHIGERRLKDTLRREYY